MSVMNFALVSKCQLFEKIRRTCIIIVVHIEIKRLCGDNIIIRKYRAIESYKMRICGR